MRSVTVDAASSLSTGGVVTVDTAGHNSGGEKAVLTLLGDGNLTTAHRLILNSFNSLVRFQCASPVVGSIEGNGSIWFGTTAITSTLRVGGNDRSTDYFGLLGDGDNFSGTPRALRLGKLVKEGTGTLTLWGECWYRGGTTVSNGTLVVNNWMNPAGPVTVCTNATLDGIGTVGIVTNLGGTVKGSLVMGGLVQGAGSTVQLTLNGAGQSDALTVNGPVNVTGSTLLLTLGAKPAVGQTFTVLNNTSGSATTGPFTCGSIVTGTYGGSVYKFQVNYQGGDGGNDIVLTRLANSTMITIQ